MYRIYERAEFSQELLSAIILLAFSHCHCRRSSSPVRWLPAAPLSHSLSISNSLPPYLSLSLSVSLIALPPSLSASRGDICSKLRNCRSIVNELIGAPRSAGITLAWSRLRSDSGSVYSVHHKLEARRARHGCSEEDGRVVYPTRFGVGCCRGYRQFVYNLMHLK